jgi:hypothetical protein
MLSNDGTNNSRNISARVSWKPNENHTVTLCPGNVNQPTEILVFSDEYSVFARSKINEFSIIGSAHHFSYREHIMTLCAQRSDNSEVTAFVRQKA